MQIANKFMMFGLVVSDMPNAKAFYVDRLGLKVATDYRQDDDHWWVTLKVAKNAHQDDDHWWKSLTLPQGGVAMTLTTFHENMKPGTISIYFATPDIVAAHKELTNGAVKVNEIKDDLFGPGSGIKWFSLEDPDGNLVHLVQA
jgi:catechol 2,3-dioxygenase-like lactoylglutathione lyase family enzyme